MFLLKTPGCFDVEHPGVFCQNIRVFLFDNIQYLKQCKEIT